MARVVSHCSRKISVVSSGMSEASLRGVARFAQEHDWHVSNDLARVGGLPRGSRCDGLIVALPQSSEFLVQLENSGTACVAFAEANEPTALTLIAPDEQEIGRFAADHLIERGHRHFAFAPLVEDAANDLRLAAFRARLLEHGCACGELPAMYSRQQDEWVENGAERRRALASELRQIARPGAVFAFNDCVAADIADACRDAGLSIPEDVAVLGVGDSIFSTSAFVPLSSIDLNLEEMGYRAAAQLEEKLSGLPVGGATRAVPPKGVVTRVSTDIIAVSDGRVARALSYIAEQYPEVGLSVDVVARAVGMSRRNLERSFRHETGRTIHEHIINVRMREAARLLTASPKATTADVAALVGLAGERTFFRVFRRHFGMSPKAHRNWTLQSRLAGGNPGRRFRPVVAQPEPPHTLAPGADFTAA